MGNRKKNEKRRTKNEKRAVQGSEIKGSSLLTTDF
jgi:hypothetical protein